MIPKRSTNRYYHHLLLLFLPTLLLLLLHKTPTTNALEAKWTPSDESDGGPLPLSTNQRQQLVRLEQTILNSPNPEETLRSTAAANEMPVDELSKLLAKNRRDLEAGAAGDVAAASGGNSPYVLRNLWSGVLAFVGFFVKVAAARPREFGTVVALWMIILYVCITAPRTGIVLSRQSSLLSRGHSTVLKPPAAYLDGYLSSSHFERRMEEFSFVGEDDTFLSKKIQKDIAGMDDDGLTFVKEVGKKASKKYAKSISFFMTSRKSISTDLLSDDDDRDDDETIQFLYDAASTVLSSRRFTESATTLQFSSSSENALLAVNKMGDWNRYGIQPLEVMHEERNLEKNTDGVESDRVLVYGSLKGGHWDGVLRFSIEKGDEGVVVSASFIVPLGGRKPNKKLAAKTLTSLTQSIFHSAVTTAKQNVARQSQTRTYKKKFESSVAAKRQAMAVKERLDEEMAKNRQRRWMRGNRNPNAGRYTPSGQRMQSPNNC